MRQEIRICGFGGQGVITAAVILGKAAAVYDDLIACQVQSYGPEARGGAAAPKSSLPTGRSATPA
jgi:2-oxoglutarate ferredoxin oxidoreductase subunit gamma